MKEYLEKLIVIVKNLENASEDCNLSFDGKRQACARLSNEIFIILLCALGATRRIENKEEDKSYLVQRCVDDMRRRLSNTSVYISESLEEIRDMIKAGGEFSEKMIYQFRLMNNTIAGMGSKI